LTHLGENIDFWLDVKEFKGLMKDEQIQQKASEIYTSYFSEFAPKQINIYGITLKRLTDNMKKPDIDIFNDANKEIFHLMETDSFKRFRSNEMSERLRRRLEHREFWNPAAFTSGSVRGTIRLSGEKLIKKKLEIVAQTSYEPYFKCGWLTKQGGGNGGRKNWYLQYYNLLTV
jgi:hypothetical protein